MIQVMLYENIPELIKIYYCKLKNVIRKGKKNLFSASSSIASRGSKKNVIFKTFKCLFQNFVQNHQYILNNLISLLIQQAHFVINNS